MLEFQGMIFKDKEDLDEYINSQTINITTDTEKLIKEIQKHFNYKITDIKELNDNNYEIDFKTDNGILIEHSFTSNEDVENIKKGLQVKINTVNQIILSVENLGIEEIKCVEILNYIDIKEIIYHFKFKIHREDEEFREVNFSSKDNIYKFIKNFRQYTSNKLEGKPSVIDWWHGDGNEIKDNDFDIPLKIDGIDVNGVIEQAIKQNKCIRLEIVK